MLSVERWVLAPLRDRRFFSLAKLNAAMAEQLGWLNSRQFRGEPASRWELFDDLERSALRPLPARRFELAAWKRVTVNIDYHVEYERRFYSEPPRSTSETKQIADQNVSFPVLGLAGHASLVAVGSSVGVRI